MATKTLDAGGNIATFLASAANGDIMQFGPGVHDQTSTATLNASSCTVRPVPGQLAVITGTTGDRLRIFGSSNILDGLLLHQTGSSDQANEIEFQGSNHTVRNCDFTNGFGHVDQTHAIKCYVGSSSVPANNFHAHNNFFHQIGRPGYEGASASIFAHAWYIRNCDDGLWEDEHFYQVLGGYAYHFYEPGGSNLRNRILRAKGQDSYFATFSDGATGVVADKIAWSWTTGTTQGPAWAGGPTAAVPVKAPCGRSAGGGSGTITNSVTITNAQGEGSGTDGMLTGVDGTNNIERNPVFADAANGDFRVTDAQAAAHLGEVTPPPTSAGLQVPFKASNWFQTPIPTSTARLGGAPAGLEGQIQTEVRTLGTRFGAKMEQQQFTTAFFYCLYSGGTTCDVYQDVVSRTSPDTSKRWKAAVAMKRVGVAGNTTDSLPDTPERMHRAVWYGVENKGWPCDNAMASGDGFACIVVVDTRNGRHWELQAYGFDPSPTVAQATYFSHIPSTLLHDGMNRTVTNGANAGDNTNAKEYVTEARLPLSAVLVKDDDLRHAYNQWATLAGSGSLAAGTVPDLGHTILVELGQHDPSEWWAPATGTSWEGTGTMGADPAAAQSCRNRPDHTWAAPTDVDNHPATAGSHSKVTSWGVGGCPNLLGRTASPVRPGMICRFDPGFDWTTYRAPGSTGTLAQIATAAAANNQRARDTIIAQVLGRTIQRYGMVNSPYTAVGIVIPVQCKVDQVGNTDLSSMFVIDGAIGNQGVNFMQSMISAASLHVLNTGRDWEAINQAVPSTFAVTARNGFSATVAAPVFRPTGTVAPPPLSQAPPVPTNVQLGTVGATHVLSWTAPSTTSVNAVEDYEVQRATNDTFTSGLVQSSMTATQSVNSSGTPGTTYFYRVRARNAIGNSAYVPVPPLSGVFPGTVPAPTVRPPDVTINDVVAFGAALAVTWLVPATTGTNAIASYRLERATNVGFTTGLTSIPVPGAATDNYADTTGTAATTYYYHVKAVNQIGESVNWSAIDSAVFPGAAARPDVVTGITATGGSDATGPFLNIGWNANDATPPVASYQIYVNDTVAFSMPNAGPGTVSYQTLARSTSQGPVQPATTYRVRVVAVGTDGQLSDFAATAQVSATTPGVPTRPPAPTGLTVTPLWDTASSRSYLTIDWTDNPPTPAVDRYGVYVNGEQVQQVTPSLLTPYYVTAGASYTVRVVAIGVNNQESDPSAAVTVTAASAPVGSPPNVPTGLTAVAGYDTSSYIDLDWVDNPEVGVTYKLENVTTAAVEPRTTSDFSWRTGLIGGTSYQFRVKAIGEDGQQSEFSAPVSAVAANPPAAGAPPVPSGLAVTPEWDAALFESRFTLDWADNEQPPPVSDNRPLAMPRGAVAGFGQAFDLLDSMGVNTRTMSSSNDPSTVWFARLVEMGFRHTRDFFFTSWTDWRYDFPRDAYINMRNRIDAIKAGTLPAATARTNTDQGQPVFCIAGTDAWPEKGNLRLDSPWRTETIEEWIQSLDGGHPHGRPIPESGQHPPWPDGTGGGPQGPVWDWEQPEHFWRTVCAIGGNNEPGLNDASDNQPDMQALKVWTKAKYDAKEARTGTTSAAGNSMICLGDLPYVSVDGLKPGDCRPHQLPQLGPSFVGHMGHFMVWYGDSTGLESRGETQYVDAGDMHNYRGGSHPSHQSMTGFLGGIDCYNGDLAVPPNRARRIPMFCTELGSISRAVDQSVWSVSSGYWPSPEFVRAEYGVREFLQNYWYGVRRSYYYTMQDTFENAQYSEYNFGLIKANGDRKEVFFALKNLAWILGPGLRGGTNGPVPYQVNGFVPQATTGGSNSPQFGYAANGPLNALHVTRAGAAQGTVFENTPDGITTLLIELSPTSGARAEYLLFVWRQASLWDREPGNTSGGGATVALSSLVNVAGGLTNPNTQALQVKLPLNTTSAEVCQPAAGHRSLAITTANEALGRTFTTMPRSSDGVNQIVTLNQGGFTQAIRFRLS